MKEENNETTSKPKRKICTRCKRPSPAACICSSLPGKPLPSFKKCRVVVLQHPHETRRKNRSVPLIDLCLSDSNANDQKNPVANENDFNFCTVIGRRLGEQTPQDIFRFIQRPNTLLLYPDENSISLEEGLEIIEKRLQNAKKNENGNGSQNSVIVQTSHYNDGSAEKNDSCDDSGNTDSSSREMVHIDEKVTLIFIDATWKYAKEMVQKNTMLNLWPNDLIRIKLSPSSPSNSEKNDDPTNKHSVPNEIKGTTYRELTKRQNSDNQINSTSILPPAGYKPRRFDIRTPPSENHLSTAECIAWVVSAIEKDGSIYETLMKPLDYMVKLWHLFDSNRGNGWTKKPIQGNKKNESRARKRPKLFSD